MYKKLFDSKLSELEQEGYGMLPGDALKLKILKNMSRKRTKQISGAGKSYKMIGSGISLPGSGKGNITNFIVKKVVPSLLSNLLCYYFYHS